MCSDPLSERVVSPSIFQCSHSFMSDSNYFLSMASLSVSDKGGSSEKGIRPTHGQKRTDGRYYMAQASETGTKKKVGK